MWRILCSDWLLKQQRLSIVILPARDCLFCFHNRILSKSKWVYESFLLQNILGDGIRFSLTSSLGWKSISTRMKNVDSCF